MRDCREYCSEDEGEGGFGELRKKGWGGEGKGSPATSISSSTSTSSNRTSAVSPLEDGPVQGRGRGVIQTWAWGGGGGAHPPGMVRRSLSEPSAFVVVRGTTATSIVRGTSPEAPLPSSTSIGDGKGLPASPLKALPPGEGEGEGIQTNSDSVSWMGRRALYVTHMVRRSCRCHRQR